MLLDRGIYDKYFWKNLQRDEERKNGKGIREKDAEMLDKNADSKNYCKQSGCASLKSPGHPCRIRECVCVVFDYHSVPLLSWCFYFAAFRVVAGKYWNSSKNPPAPSYTPPNMVRGGCREQRRVQVYQRPVLRSPSTFNPEKGKYEGESSGGIWELIYDASAFAIDVRYIEIHISQFVWTQTYGL